MPEQGSKAAPPAIAETGYRPAGAAETVAGNRSWWDGSADEYLTEHGAFLAGRLVWGPEGLTEAEAGLLGEVAGRVVLEVGAGAAQCSSWLAGRGARTIALDLSIGMLRSADRQLARLRPDGEPLLPGADGQLARLQADARQLPLAAGSIDVAFSSYGALPFVADPELIMAEVARVLRPGGRWVFAVPHPVRWAFPDDPGPGGLTVTRSYFERLPYVETDADGVVRYAEHHRTMGDWVRLITTAGLQLVDLREPEWPAGHDQIWGGWSPLRGAVLPGTAIFVTTRP